jgi:hypothetical protein
LPRSQNNLVVLAMINIVLYGFALMWVGPATADVHNIAGPHLRGLGIGIFFSVANIAARHRGASDRQAQRCPRRGRQSRKDEAVALGLSGGVCAVGAAAVAR